MSSMPSNVSEQHSHSNHTSSKVHKSAVSMASVMNELQNPTNAAGGAMQNIFA